MFNIRYHIASLVGVFLALALGLILGGLVVQRGTVEDQQGALVEGLRKEFAALRIENEDLTDQNRLLGAYSGRVTDEWVSGRLKGRLIVIVTNVGREIGSAEAAEAIESAGGVVATAVILKPGLGLDDTEVRSDIASRGIDPDADLESIAATVAAELTMPAGARPVIDALVAAGVLRLEGFVDGAMATGLVNVATSNGDADSAGVALAAAFGKSGSSLCAQPDGTDTGVAAAARTAGVSAFDTLGTDVGRYTLVALMTGSAPGYYGTGTGTAGFFPPQ